MAILLAAARALQRRRAEIAGTIVFCFQPGEEGHCGQQADDRRRGAGKPARRPDVRAASVQRARRRQGRDPRRAVLRVVGSVRHRADRQGWPRRDAARSAVDPIVGGGAGRVAAADDREPRGRRERAGRRYGRLAPRRHDVQRDPRAGEDARNRAGVRRRGAHALPERIERCIAGLCEAMRLEYAFDYKYVYPPTVNDAATNDVVREVARALAAPADVVDPHPIVMWSEDMSFMQQQRPGAYFLVGARGGDVGLEPHHSARFDIDERALERRLRHVRRPGAARLACRRRSAAATSSSATALREPRRPNSCASTTRRARSCSSATSPTRSTTASRFRRCCAGRSPRPR